MTKKRCEDIVNPDEFEEVEEGKNEKELTFHQIVKFQRLFQGLKFFLNSEVPRESLVFVIRSFGGEVSWDKFSLAGATFDENDDTITHQIVDRDNVDNKYINRYYIQPQWVYDSINAMMLLPVEDYFLGATLPPHLSPFVEEKPGDYIPPEKQALLKMQQGLRSTRAAENDSESEEGAEDEGIKEKEFEQEISAKRRKLEVEEGKAEKEDKVKSRIQQEAEEKRLAVMMIPKKKKRLYSKIVYGQKRKSRETEKLTEKRQNLDRKHKKNKH